MAKSAFIYDSEKKEFRQRSISEGILSDSPHRPVVKAVPKQPDPVGRDYYRPPIRPQAASPNEWKKYFWGVCSVLILIWVVTVATQLRNTANTKIKSNFSEESELDFLGGEPKLTR